MHAAVTLQRLTVPVIMLVATVVVALAIAL